MGSILRWLFPCWFNEPNCQDNFWGCRCGKGGSKKAETRADDLAKQQAVQAATTQQAVEAKTAPTLPEQARTRETFGLEQRQQPFLEARARATPEDLFRQLGPLSAQYAQGVQQRAGQTPAELFSGISPESAQLAQYISQRFGMSPQDLFGGISPAAAGLQERLTSQAGLTPDQQFGALGPEAGQLSQRVQQNLQTPPQIPFEDTFNPEYQLLRQNVLGDAARRGFGTGSGLEIEQLGRAGVDLAIRKAGLRQQNAQINQQLRQQTLSDASSLIAQKFGVSQSVASQLAALIEAQHGLKTEATGQQEGLVQSQQSLAEQARQQALGVGEAGANASTQARQELASYFANLQNLSEASRGRQTQGVAQSYQAAEPFQGRAGQFQTNSLTALNQRVQQSREDTQAIGKALASAAAIAAAGPTGGASLMALPAIGSYGGGGGSQPTGTFGTGRFAVNPSGVQGPGGGNTLFNDILRSFPNLAGGSQYPGSSSSLLAGSRQSNAAQQPFYGGGYQAALQQDPGLANVYQNYPQRRRTFGGGWTS